MKASQALLALIANPPAVEFMSSALTAGIAATGAVTKPSGVEVGDLVVLWALDCTSAVAVATASGSGWNVQTVSIAAASTNGYGAAFWKVLTATDVANAWNLTGAAEDGVLAIRYRAHGATGATVKDTTSNGSGTTTFTLDGFTKAAGHYGAIALFGASSSAGAGGIVGPSGFAERRRDSGAGLAGTFVAIVADLVSGYPDLIDVVFSNCDGNATEYGILLEITGP